MKWVCWGRSSWCWVWGSRLYVWHLIYYCWCSFLGLVLILLGIWYFRGSQYDLLWWLSGHVEFLYSGGGCCIWSWRKWSFYRLGRYVFELGTWFQFLGLFLLLDGFQFHWGGDVQIHLHSLVPSGPHQGLGMNFWGILVYRLQVQWLGKRCGECIYLGRLHVIDCVQRLQSKYCWCRHGDD